MRQVLRDFQDGNVCVTGLRGRGKDMLFANVVQRRDIPYVSNVDYGAEWNEFHPRLLSIGATYKDFIDGTLPNYKYPFADGTDVYISDCGVYFPSQYNGELNRDYKDVPTFMALSRHVGKCNVHVNVQNLNRCWDKLREMSDVYYQCEWCKVLFGVVIQSVLRYEKYDSCINRVKPFNEYYPKRPLLNRERQQKWDIEKARYSMQHGKIKRYLLIYLNKSDYDTRVFKQMLEGAKNEE